LLPYLLLFGIVFGAAAVTMIAANRRQRPSVEVLYGEVVDDE